MMPSELPSLQPSVQPTVAATTAAPVVPDVRRRLHESNDGSGNNNNNTIGGAAKAWASRWFQGRGDKADDESAETVAST
jgi:hypothetical protein